MPSIQHFDATMHMLQKVLDLRSKNQEVISSNIANADTPGFAPSTLHFEEELRSVIANGELNASATHANHIQIAPHDFSQVNGTLVTEKDNTGIGDENGVSVDAEMIKLSKNQLLYEAAVTMLNKKLSILKYAANDGK